MADNNPAETYRLAYKEALQETERVQSLIDKLQALSAQLHGKGWKTVGIRSGSQTFLYRGTPPDRPGVALSDLPTADQIHRAIVDWHRKRDNLERLVAAVSRDDLNTLPDPKTLDN